MPVGAEYFRNSGPQRKFKTARYQQIDHIEGPSDYSADPQGFSRGGSHIEELDGRCWVPTVAKCSDFKCRIVVKTWPLEGKDSKHEVSWHREFLI
jgi:hypothetical protein